MRYLLSFVKSTIRNLYVLMFVNGFLLSTLIYFKSESSYEDRLFDSIKASMNQRLVNHDDNGDSVAVKAMNVCYHLMQPRLPTFANAGSDLPEAAPLFFHPLAEDLITASGACGSFALVLARIIDTYHYPVRIAQMQAESRNAAHIVVEVYTGASWVVLDPTYNLCFTRPDGRLASFYDVGRDWNYYVHQTPPDYDGRYQYQDVRYTNWNKIPVLMPAIKKLMTLAIGAEKTNGFCMRTHFLNVFKVYFYLILVLETGMALLTAKRLARTSKWPFLRSFRQRRFALLKNLQRRP